MAQHFEWKSVCMIFIIILGFCFCVDDTLSYVAPTSISGQDMVNAINALGLWISIITIIGFGAKWAADFLAKKIGLKENEDTTNPKKED